MKLSILTALYSSILLIGASFAVLASTDHPDGNLTIYNASDNDVTAKMHGAGRFILGNHERKEVSYSTLSYACASNPTNCTAHFYVNNAPAGSATINVTNGNLVYLNLNMKVQTEKDPDNVLRAVIFK